MAVFQQYARCFFFDAEERDRRKVSISAVGLRIRQLNVTPPPARVSFLYVTRPSSSTCLPPQSVSRLVILLYQSSLILCLHAQADCPPPPPRRISVILEPDHLFCSHLQPLSSTLREYLLCADLVFFFLFIYFFLFLLMRAVYLPKAKKTGRGTDVFHSRISFLM